MENFGLVFVHESAQWHEPVVNQAKKSYVLVYLDEECLDAVALLKLELQSYHGIGAVFVSKVLDKTKLVLQTGIDLVWSLQWWSPWSMVSREALHGCLQGEYIPFLH